MSGWKDWAIGEVVTESDFQSFVQDQVVQRYTDATDRDNTLGANVAEGMIAYTENDNSIQYYDGSVWQVLSTGGDITAVTAGTALTGGGTAGDVTLDVDISALATAHAGNALNANGELLDVDESAITVAQSQVTDLVSDLADKADNADFTGGTAGYTALSNGTAGLSYQPVSHNYIINGAFDIWQRGDSFSGSDQYTTDRWRINANTQSVTVSKQEFSSGEIEAVGFGDAASYLRYANDGLAVNQGVQTRIEDARTLAGQTATLSFWAKASSASTLRATFFQAFGSGGSSTVFFNAGDSSLTTSWQRFTLTVSIPSVSGKTINSGNYFGLFLITPTATASTVDIWGVQLEAGSIATPFKRNANSIQGELAACQRYYLALGGTTNYPNSFGYAATSTEVRAIIPTPVRMRATPSLVDPTPRIRIGSSNLAPSSTTVQGTLAGNGVQVSYAQTGMTPNNPAVITHDSTANLSAEL